jgi:hypothetical protein
VALGFVEVAEVRVRDTQVLALASTKQEMASGTPGSDRKDTGGELPAALLTLLKIIVLPLIYFQNYSKIF